MNKGKESTASSNKGFHLLALTRSQRLEAEGSVRERRRHRGRRGRAPRRPRLRGSGPGSLAATHTCDGEDDLGLEPGDDKDGREGGRAFELSWDNFRTDSPMTPISSSGGRRWDDDDATDSPLPLTGDDDEAKRAK